MNSNNIGATLHTLRENAGLSARNVADILKNSYNIDMEHNTLYNYEKGRSSPDINRFLTLCMIYNCLDILYEFGYTTERHVFKEPTAEDEEILNRYHKLPESGRKMILGALGIEKEKTPTAKIS